MSAKSRTEAAADLLADGYDPDEVTILAMAYRALIDLVNFKVSFELTGANLDRADATKYGTHPDGSARYAPEWYVAQGIRTGIHEALYGTLSGVLSCEERSETGRQCCGSILHPPPCWDGDGDHWNLPEPS